MSGANRTAKISTRVRPRERRLLDAAAEARGVHLSELVRDAALAEARRELRGPHDDTAARPPARGTP